MTIAVDFDGTIVEHRYPEIGREYPFAIETLKKLVDNGHRLILWTVRDGKLLDEAVEFCKSRGLEFYAVNSEFPNGGWKNSGSRKLRADLYIDDRNLGGVPDWNMVYEMVSEHLTYADLLERMGEDSGNVLYNDGTYRKRDSHHRKHRKCFIVRVVDRCREARANFNIH